MTTLSQGVATNRTAVYCVALATSLAIGCSQGGGTAPSPVSGPPTVNADGTWVGKTSQAGSATPITNVSTGYFSVTVIDNRLRELNVQVSFPPPCPGELAATWALNTAVGGDGAFTSSASSPASTLLVSGAFTSTGEASGSITVTYGSTIACPSTVATSWTAQKS
jgi:hypothetical protein